MIVKRKVGIIAVVALLCLLAGAGYWLGTYKQRELRFRTVNVDIPDDYQDICYGSDTAQLTIYMFSTYGCRHCRNFLMLDLPYVRQRYVDSGLVRFVIKPIEPTEDKDMLSALQLAVCMNQNGTFDDINELLLTEPSAVYTEEFKTLVDDIINGNRELAECLVSNDFAYIRQNNALFDKLGSKGTPIFVVGDHLYRGHRKIEQFCHIVEYELNRNK